MEKTKPDQRELFLGEGIHFTMVNQQEFKGSLNILYKTPITEISKDELDKLKQIGFKQSQSPCEPIKTSKSYLIPCKYPIATIDLIGSVHEAIPDQDKLPHKMKQPYPISIIQKQPTDKKSKSNKLGNIAAGIVIAPIAVVGAIIIIPIAIFGIALSEDNPFK